MRRIRAFVADDHPELLAAMVSVLEDDRRFQVVGTASTGKEALSSAPVLRPDVVLLDVHMPGGGASAARALTGLPDPPAVVAISAQSGAGIVEEMLRAGAVGYLTKGHVGDALPDLLVRCADGEVVLASPAAAEALRALRGVPASPG